MKQSIIRKPFRYSYNNVAFGLIVVNVLIFMLNYISPHSRFYTALIPGVILQRGFIWQFVTYMFTHAGFSHILFNMLGIFFFGVQVERRMGSSEFLLFYMVTGFLAGLFSFIV